MKYKFFSYGAEDEGFELHETAEKAMVRAEECLSYYLDDNGDWDNSAKSVCWGEIRESSREIEVVEDGVTYCDYFLKPV